MVFCLFGPSAVPVISSPSPVFRMARSAFRQHVTRETSLQIHRSLLPCFGSHLSRLSFRGFWAQQPLADDRLGDRVTALVIVGTACVMNALRCGRVHCYIPFFLVMALVTLQGGLGVVSLGRKGRIAIELTILVGAVALIYRPEILLGKTGTSYRRMASSAESYSSDYSHSLACRRTAAPPSFRKSPHCRG